MEIILPKIAATGIYDTDIAVKNRAVTKNRKTTMFEIELPIKEQGISHINKEQRAVKTDTLICAKPGQTRHTRLPYKCYFIHMMVKGQLCDILSLMPDFIKVENPERYADIFKKLIKYNELGAEKDELIIQSLVLKLIYTLSEESVAAPFKEKAKSCNMDTIEKVIEYINSNLTSDLSLETVAKIAGFSPIHFHNCFKASTGYTLRSFVENSRIKKAANMLLTTNHTLTEIAYECGFSSQSYFSYAFKRRMNKTPREYAKNVFSLYEN